MLHVVRLVGICTIFSAALCAAGLTASVRGAEPAASWLTDAKLRERLQQPVAIMWSNRSGVPFRHALSGLGQSQQLAILLDRRIDPDQKVELTTNDATLDTTLKLIASKLSIGVGQVGSVIYFGPEATARKVRTLAALRYEEIRHVPVPQRMQLARVRPWRWDDLATPRELLAELGQQCQIEIRGTDQIPHDLWAAADLPPMNFCDRLTLVAAQFDLTFSIDPSGQSVTLVPIPATVEISHTYRLPAGIEGGAQNKLVANVTNALPDARVSHSSGTITVRGRAEDQEFVESLLEGGHAKQTTVTKSEKRYTLPAVSMAVGDLVRTLGRRLNLDVEFDEAAIQAAGLSLKTEVNVNVKDATEKELLHAVLDPAGLTFDRKGTGIVVRPKK